MICINWDGFPQYGARCVGALVKALNGEKVVVVAMRPVVPIKGMEKLAGCPVIWIDSNEKRGIAEICGEMPRYISISGWFSPLYNRWRDEVRAAGGRASCGCDNNYPLESVSFNFRGLKTFCIECLKALRFRLFVLNKFDAFFVPGKSGRKLFHFYGVPDDRIFEGSYTADSSLFKDGLPLPRRAKKMIFVGRFVPYKNVLRMVEAFAHAVEIIKQAWTLDIYGCGPLKSELDALVASVNKRISLWGGKVVLHEFLQPEEIAVKYREARLFCLPSVSEHWGVVVHEAALSGCILLLSDKIGAGDDMLVPDKERSVTHGGKCYRNGFVFDPYSVDSMAHAMQMAMRMDDVCLIEAQRESVRVAQRTSLQRFVDSVLAMSGTQISD